MEAEEQSQRVFASSFMEGSVHVLALNGQELGKKKFGSCVTQVDVNSANSLVCAGSANRCVYVVDSQLQLRHTLTMQAPVTAVRFCRNMPRVLYGDEQGHVQAYDLSHEIVLVNVHPHDEAITSIFHSLSGAYVALSSADRIAHDGHAARPASPG
eukprot:m.782359 g.782359  ORF g.782359 m.782359 type:complete len:155 (+) comp59152_c1_seq16:115-579(+)